jgi:hypothetical protein
MRLIYDYRKLLRVTTSILAQPPDLVQRWPTRARDRPVWPTLSIVRSTSSKMYPTRGKTMPRLNRRMRATRAQQICGTAFQQAGQREAGSPPAGGSPPLNDDESAALALDTTSAHDDDSNAEAADQDSQHEFSSRMNTKTKARFTSTRCRWRPHTGSSRPCTASVVSTGTTPSRRRRPDDGTCSPISTSCRRTGTEGSEPSPRRTPWSVCRSGPSTLGAAATSEDAPSAWRTSSRRAKRSA